MHEEAVEVALEVRLLHSQRVEIGRIAVYRVGRREVSQGLCPDGTE